MESKFMFFINIVESIFYLDGYFSEFRSSLVGFNLNFFSLQALKYESKKSLGSFSQFFSVKQNNEPLIKTIIIN